MEIKLARLNENEVERYTWYAKELAKDSLKRVFNFLHDEEKKKRLEEEFECAACWYLRRPRLAGQALTNTKCRVCFKDMLFHNTDVDKTCKDCAKEYGLCCYCGGDIQGRLRRKKKVPE